MSLLQYKNIDFYTITSKDDYSGEITTSQTISCKCRFFDKKAINYSGDDNFLDYDAVAHVLEYQPENGSLAKFKGRDYKVVDVRPLQALKTSKRYAVSLRNENV